MKHCKPLLLIFSITLRSFSLDDGYHGASNTIILQSVYMDVDILTYVDYLSY